MNEINPIAENDNKTKFSLLMNSINSKTIQEIEKIFKENIQFYGNKYNF